MTRRSRSLRSFVVVLCIVGAVSSAAADSETYEEAVARGRGLLAEGRPQEADRAFVGAAEQARRHPIREEALRREVGALAGCLSARGMLADLMGTREVSRRLLELRIEMGNEARTAGTRANLGYFEAELGNFEAAWRLLEEARTYAAAKGEPALLAAVLSRLSQLRFLQRRHADALGYAEDALAVAKRAKLGRDVADAQGLLGVVYLDLGDLQRAIAEYERVLAWAETNDPFVAADAHSHIAIARRLQGRYQDALDGFAQAAETYGAAHDLRRMARVHIQRSEVHVDLDDLDAAVSSLAVARKLLEDDALTDAYARVQLGVVHLRRGQAAQARPHLEAALATGRDLGDRHLEARARAGLAAAELVDGTTTVATGHVQRALTLVDEMVSGLAPTEGASGRGERAFVYRAAIEVGFASHDPERILEMIERSRAATLLRSAWSSARAAGRDVPAALADVEDAARLRLLEARAQNAAARKGGRRGAIREAARARDAARLAYEDVLTRIQRRREETPGAGPKPRTTLSEVQAALADEEVFVAYALGTRETYALVVTPDAARPVSLGPHARMAAALVASPGPDLEPAEIGQTLVAPLGLGKAARRVLVSPDGVLARLPFALLFPDREVALVPSATVHVHLCSRADLRGHGVLACGDPRYAATRDGHTFAVYAGRARLLPLPASREEVEAIVEEGDVRLLDEGATETAFREQVSERKRWRSVHLACHGIVHDERPGLSALALTPDDTHDGFLTALEVFGLSVPADLVVLSACETGLGRTFTGDGLVGLSLAFLHAGAPRVLCSLWKADDAATRALMVHFYRLWRTEGLEAGDALRRAQAAVRAVPKWRNPKFWAGWVLWGLSR